MFGILESVYDFISSSKNQVSLFEECQKQKYKNERRIKRLKRVETTRWWSHDYALNTVIDTYDALCETLDVLQTENNSSDRKRLHQAASLKDCLTSDWFLLTAFLYKTIFNIITPLSKLLQTKDIDMIGVVTEVQKKISELKNSRSNFKFQNIVNEVENFKKSSTLSYENFKPLAQKRTKRIPQLPGELASDEIIENPLDNFKINTFFVAYDTSITQIESRFTEQTSGIFKDISLFSRRRIEEISKDLQAFPKDAFSVFADVYKKYINVEDLRREYLHFCKCYFGFEKIKYIPTKLHNSNNDEIHEDTSSSSDSGNSN